ncbi:MAG: RIP metalloprotease RseP [Cycloclasticus sp.]|nr:RIP metalloprotease RseP [Cycloclasticus sp.]
MEILISIISFVVALGILVTIHEFGHFWVARKCGVKVLRFSVGFGKTLFRFKRKNDPTEYVLAAIPLGGYVKMLDEREGNVKEDEKHLAFNNKSLFSRFLIVLAGPAFNLIFAFILFWAILIIGEDGLRPVVGGFNEAGLAAHSGLEVGDEIIAVNNRPSTIWRVAIGRMASEILDKGVVELTVAKPGGQKKTLILGNDSAEMIEPSDVLGRIGIEPLLPSIKPIIDNVVPGQRGDEAGFISDDLVLSVNQKNIDTWKEWVELTRSHPDTAMNVVVLRKSDKVSLTVTPKGVKENDQLVGKIGVSVFFESSLAQRFYTTYSLSGLAAISEAALQTFSYSILTVKLIGRMIIGEASIQNLSGPISLAQYAGKTASIGLVSFLKFLAFVSISLGVMNLLPIPMLDGGHLFFYLIEAIKGKPLSENVQAGFMRLGIFVLIGFMTLAVFIDVGRLID